MAETDGMTARAAVTSNLRQALADKAERILRRREVLDRVGVSQSTLYAWMAEGTFPRPVALGSKLVGWPESAVTGWIDARRTRDGKTAAQLRQEAAARLSGDTGEAPIKGAA